MNTVKQVQLDLRKNTNKIIDICKQWDRNSRTIEFEIIEDGNKVLIDPEKCLLVVAIRKPDGWFIFNDCEIKEDSIISVLFDEQMTGSAGICYGEIRIYDVELKTLAISSTFKMRVNETVVDDFKIQSSYEYNALTNILLNTSIVVKKCEEVTKAAEDKIVEINDLEETWKAAEDTRIANEQQRELNEQQRKENEINRNKKVDDSLDECKKATDDAIKATNDANTATTNANNAADRANVAADVCENIVKIIDDTVVATAKTWSSNKISNFLNEYVTQDEIDAIFV